MKPVKSFFLNWSFYKTDLHLRYNSSNSPEVVLSMILEDFIDVPTKFIVSGRTPKLIVQRKKFQDNWKKHKQETER